MTDRRPLLRVNELTLTLTGGTRLLDRFQLEILPGEVAALVGESGAGKTLTALALIGLLPAAIKRSSGEAFFGDVNLFALSPRQLRAFRGKKIAVVFQEPGAALDPLIRVGRALQASIHVHLGFRGEKLKSEAGKLLKEVGIKDPASIGHAFPDQLSGGQRQRVMIALALSGRPRLLIADEPTSALDAALRVRLLSLLKRVTEQRQLACLLISHDLAAVARLAQRVTILRRGKIVEAAPTREIFTSPQHPYTKELLTAAGV